MALDFAKKDGQTLLIAVSDHNTGGMSIGNRTTDKTYSQMKLTGVAPAKQSVLLTPLKDMTLTAAGIWRKLGPEPSPERLKTLVKEHWSLELGDDEIEQILQRAANYRETPFYGLAEVVSARHTVVGWTTHGHAGGDVPLFAYGPGKPSGLLEAPQVARAMARAMGIDLAQATRRLFAEADSALPGAKRTLDRSDPRDPVVVIEHRGKTARLPVNGNLLELDGRRHKLEGVVLHSEATGKTYLPRQAVRLIAAKVTGRRGPSPLTAAALLLELAHSPARGSAPGAGGRRDRARLARRRAPNGREPVRSEGSSVSARFGSRMVPAHSRPPRGFPPQVGAAHPMSPTCRQALAELLRRQSLSARELAEILLLEESEVEHHLEHLRRSHKSRLRLAPARCLACGYVFRGRERIKAPGRCPCCREERVAGPWFRLAD